MTPRKEIFVLTAVFFLSGSFLLTVKWSRRSHAESLMSGPQALLNEGKRLSLLQNWPTAASVFEQAEIQFGRLGNRRSEAFARIGRIRSRAEEMSQREVSRLLGQECASAASKTDKEMQLWCLVSKAPVDFSFDTGEAKRDYLAALEIAKNLGDKVWIARITGKIGVIEFLEGQAIQAESDVSKALTSAYLHGDVGAEIDFLSVTGMGLNEVGRSDEALLLLRHAISIAESTEGAGFPYLAYQGLGAALLARGDRNGAWKALQTGLSKAISERQHGEQGFFLALLGDVCVAGGDLDGAKRNFEEAGRAFTSIDFDRGLDEAMLKLAKLYRAGGNLEQAAKALLTGLKAGPGMDAFYRPRTLTALAQLRIAQKKYSEANALFDQAEDTREATLIKLHSPIDIGTMAGSISETYFEHFRLAAEQNDLPRALAILERVRGRAAAGLLYAQNTDHKESPQEANLNSRINSVQRSLMETEDAKKRAGLLQTLYELERALALLDNESTLDEPGLPRTRLTLSSLKESLMPDEVLLEYVVGEPNSYCIAISKSKVELITLKAGGTRLRDLVDTYLKHISEKGAGVYEATALYDLLIAPVVSRFAHDRLIISPDGPLSLLPFETLRNAKSEFLLRTKTIFYVPSATELYLLRTLQQQPAPLPLLAIGDVDYGAVHVRRPDPNPSLATSILRSLADFKGNQLKPLPGSRDEVLSIAHKSDQNAVVLIGRNATETAFKREPLSDFSVIHLATHAVPDPQYPLRAAVILGADGANDGLLQVREILRLRLRADLVSLSACETAIGTSQGEAGIASLEQAFLAAGARATVGSLWKVEDYSASKLMQRFYEFLARGEDKATALQHAKLDMLRRNGEMSPYYWAAFRLQGEGSRPVSLARKLQ